MELLASVKRRSHLDMCARLDEAGVVSEVDAIVAARFQEWAATRMTGLTEEESRGSWMSQWCGSPISRLPREAAQSARRWTSKARPSLSTVRLSGSSWRM